MKIKKKHIFIMLTVLIALFAIPFFINNFVINSTQKYLIEGSNYDEIQQAASLKTADCILVLGAGIRPDGTPSLMLKDRLDVGIRLYKDGVAEKLILSGDNGDNRYDEVNAMKEYVMAEGIPLEDIFLDHAGFSTYDSMYRAKAIFDVDKVIVVTQRYHQYRALYMGRGLGLEAYGVVSEPKQYVGQKYRDFREFLARNKDFFKMMLKPSPTFLGETIPIHGSGIPSHD